MMKVRNKYKLKLEYCEITGNKIIIYPDSSLHIGFKL